MAQNPYSVKTIVLVGGERLPVLIENATGMPLFESMIYALSELRATNKASNTIDQILRSIMLLQLFLKSNNIDLSIRISQGQIFSLSEIDELVRNCRRPVANQVGTFAAPSPKAIQFHTGSAEILRLAQRKNTALLEVAGHTAANRVRVIRDYLDWLVKYYMTRYQANTAEYMGLRDAWSSCIGAFNARVPRHKGRNSIAQREGLTLAATAKLLEVILPDSSRNPWRGESTRIRNYLMLRWLYDFGLRRGELLNLKISDINFQAENVTIARRADDPEDPRRWQPKVKTRDRMLPLSPGLGKLTYEYIIKIRHSIGKAKHHPFLFVAIGTGAPLSLNALNKITADIKKALPGEFETLTPHVLRHTWNDRFSRTADNMNISESDEEHQRSFLMGWSPTSKTAGTYTRRHIREKAQQVSLKMQAQQVKDENDIE